MEDPVRFVEDSVRFREDTSDEVEDTTGNAERVLDDREDSVRFGKDTSDGVKDTVGNAERVSDNVRRTVCFVEDTVRIMEGVLRLIEDAVVVMHCMTDDVREVIGLADDEVGTAVCLFPAELDD